MLVLICDSHVYESLNGRIDIMKKEVHHWNNWKVR